MFNFAPKMGMGQALKSKLDVSAAGGDTSGMMAIQQADANVGVPVGGMMQGGNTLAGSNPSFGNPNLPDGGALDRLDKAGQVGGGVGAAKTMNVMFASDARVKAAITRLLNGRVSHTAPEVADEDVAPSKVEFASGAKAAEVSTGTKEKPELKAAPPNPKLRFSIPSKQTMDKALGPQTPGATRQTPGEQTAEGFLDSLKPEEFTYKDPAFSPTPEDFNKPQLGILAQDVEKGPTGSTIVKEDPQTGLKQIAVKPAVSALLASAAYLKDENDALQARLSRLESKGLRGK